MWVGGTPANVRASGVPLRGAARLQGPVPARWRGHQEGCTVWPRKPQDQSGRQGAFLSGPWAPPLPQTHPWPHALHPLQPVSKGLWLPGLPSVDPHLPLTVPAATVAPPHSKSCWSCVPFSFWKYSEASQALGGAPKALSHLRGPPPLPDRPPPSRESSFRPRRKGPRLYRAPGQREDRSLLFPTPSSTSRHRTPRIPGLLRAPPLGGRRHHLIGQRREGGGQGSVSDRRRPSSGGAQVVRSPGRRSLCSPLRCPGKTPPTWRSAGQAGPSAAPHTLPGAPGGRMWTRLRRKPAPATGPQMVREAREGGPGSW